MARTVKAPDIRRQELLDTGLELYMKKGMTGLNIKEIAGRAEVAPGLFYYYFPSKEVFVDEVLHGFIVKNVEGMQTILSSGTGTAPEKIRLALDAFWDHAQQSAYYQNRDGLRGKQHLSLTNQLLEQVLPVLSRVVQEGTLTGDFHTDNPVLATRFILYGLSSVLSASETITEKTKQDMRKLIFTALGFSEV